MDELFLLRQAMALAKHRNFARAAASLHIAQPSLTRGIAALERSVGAQLFNRVRRGITPTAFGEVLLQRAEVLLRGHSDLRRELQLLGGLAIGSIAIGAGPYSAEDSVAEAVARVVQAHPALRIECTIAEPDLIVQEVLAGRFDVGVARPPAADAGARLVIEPFTPLRAYMACRPGHPLASHPRPTMALALKFPLVTIRLRGAQAALASSTLAGVPESDDESGQFVPQVVVNSVAVARKVARGSDAIFPGTAGTLAEDVAAGRLVILDIDAPALHSPRAALYLRDRSLAPAAREFLDILRLVEAEVAATALTLQAKRRIRSAPRAATARARNRAPR